MQFRKGVPQGEPLVLRTSVDELIGPLSCDSDIVELKEVRMATSYQDFLVELTENRLQQSLARLNSTDNRALGLLGLVAVLLTGLWALNFRHGINVARTNLRDVIAIAFLVIALLAAGTSLLLTAQYDSPDMTALYEKYYAAKDRLYAAYFSSAFEAIALNEATAKRKSWWLLVATVAIFLGVLVIMG